MKLIKLMPDFLNWHSSTAILSFEIIYKFIKVWITYRIIARGMKRKFNFKIFTRLKIKWGISTCIFFHRYIEILDCTKTIKSDFFFLHKYL